MPKGDNNGSPSICFDCKRPIADCKFLHTHRPYEGSKYLVRSRDPKNPQIPYCEITECPYYTEEAVEQKTKVDPLILNARYAQLLEAIADSARADLLNAYKRLKLNPKNIDAKKIATECEMFYLNLSPATGAQLIEEIKKEAKYGKR